MYNEKTNKSQQVDQVRKGPWTIEEDMILINYIAVHGEGVWNSLAQAAGLKRTGKSCRLRWLNYLKPDIRRGNITSDEQVLIMELHAKWGNRWSKIAKHLPGRTDNEIKNFWRTRIHKQLKQRQVHDGGGHRHNHHHDHTMECDNDHTTWGHISYFDQYYQEQAANTSHSSPMTTTADDHESYHHHVVYRQPYNSPSMSIDEYILDATVPPLDVNMWNVEDMCAMQLLNGE